MEGPSEIDSLAERKEFELAVPLERESLDFAEEKGLQVDQRGQKQASRFSRETSGSNPLCSAGESVSPVSSMAAGAKTRLSPGVRAQYAEFMISLWCSHLSRLRSIWDPICSLSAESAPRKTATGIVERGR